MSTLVDDLRAELGGAHGRRPLRPREAAEGLREAPRWPLNKTTSRVNILGRN